MEVLQIWAKNMERKSEIRKQFLAKRSSLPETLKAEYDAVIAGKVIRHPLYQKAKDVFCYMPIRQEVETREIIEHAWSMGKAVAVPKVMSKTQIQLYYISSFAELQTGAFGVMEPISANHAEPEEALVLVPGSVFDRQCGRMGYGGGYYDRFLAEHPAYQTIGLAYSLQIAETLPLEKTDIQMGQIFTEKFDYERQG